MQAYAAFYVTLYLFARLIFTVFNSNLNKEERLIRGSCETTLILLLQQASKHAQTLKIEHLTKQQSENTN
jgi:hypothetical protein